MSFEGIFRDRREAGRILAHRLQQFTNAPDKLVLALPRGGVPVAYEVAQALDAPLDVFLVRKLGAPGAEELAMGALASGGVRVLNRPVIEHLRVPSHVIERVTARERAELQRRERAYRNNRPSLSVIGKTVLLVDDGLATGATMRAAVVALQQLGPRRLVVAVPVAELETCEALRAEVDDLVCAFTPEPFDGVGKWYADFAPVSDAEVRELMEAAEREHS